MDYFVDRCATFCLVSRHPNFFAHLIGVQVASNLIFFVAICLLLYLTFSLTRHLSKQSVQIRQLAQKIALKEKSDQDEE